MNNFEDVIGTRAEQFFSSCDREDEYEAIMAILIEECASESQTERNVK